jgi:hypothetical protein
MRLQGKGEGGAVILRNAQALRNAPRRTNPTVFLSGCSKGDLFATMLILTGDFTLLSS